MQYLKTWYKHLKLPIMWLLLCFSTQVDKTLVINVHQLSQIHTPNKADLWHTPSNCPCFFVLADLHNDKLFPYFSSSF